MDCYFYYVYSLPLSFSCPENYPHRVSYPSILFEYSSYFYPLVYLLLHVVCESFRKGTCHARMIVTDIVTVQIRIIHIIVSFCSSVWCVMALMLLIHVLLGDFLKLLLEWRNKLLLSRTGDNCVIFFHTWCTRLLLLPV